MNGLTQEDSSLIGFVVACYFCDAIDNNDLNKWAEYIIATRDSYPPYILDLLYFDEPRFHIYRTIGFTPSSVTNQKEDIALFGITYLRGRSHLDGPPQEVALAKLKTSVAIQKRFRDTFPFIEVPLER
jgi:hypothetical protein